MNNQTIIPFTCPHCGANVWQLENTWRVSRRGNIVLMQKCTVCESTFDVGSIFGKTGFHALTKHAHQCIDDAILIQIESVLDDFRRLIGSDEPAKAEV